MTSEERAHKVAWYIFNGDSQTETGPGSSHAWLDREEAAKVIAMTIREAEASAYDQGYQNGESSMIADYYAAFDASDAPELASISAEPHGGPSELVELVLKAILAEREACAQMVEKIVRGNLDGNPAKWTMPEQAAAAIRARP